MGEWQRNRRLAFLGVLIAAVACAFSLCYLDPFDSYLLKSWESELSTIDDEEVEVRLEQIAALGERSLPTLVSALHNERQLVATTAAALLRRELDELELRSTDESSRVVAVLAQALAARSEHPGPFSAPASTQLATRLLLWPINRELIDGERLVADCELIIRSAAQSSHDPAAEQPDENVEPHDGVASRGYGTLAAELLTPVAHGGLPVQLMETPPLPPQETHILSQSPEVPTGEPPRSIAVRAPRALDSIPRLAADKATRQPASQPLAAAPRQRLELRRDPATPSDAKTRLDFRVMADLDLMQQLASGEESQARQAIDELRRRGFQSKHLRLAEALVDPDPHVRFELVRSLPQMSGIDSRPWLLWLSRDLDPAVRKAAVTVIATSPDSALLQRVRELEREETDEEVLQVVRQILSTRQTSPIR